MSAIHSAVPNRGHSVPANFHPSTLLSLNDLFKESLQRAQGRDAGCGVVVRCEQLPQVMGNREECLRVFDLLAACIFSAPPTGSKRFLHVDCEEDNILKTPPGEGFKWFRIRFHTNITADEAWMKAHQEALDTCSRILSVHGATFAAYYINHTGCLFSITVPGKSQ